jgi:hypothetical protein
MIRLTESASPRGDSNAARVPEGCGLVQGCCLANEAMDLGNRHFGLAHL